ncbi:hypothetical protein HDC34_000160 [Pseudoclavibacter sp. JAI123]|uniref:FhaA domain-containing protein n=1 Tax=Pseudoclavibacter sp. JAI123 TaxID=2723065 RepID=UPI0015CC2E90|nr:DUF3662 and FHA domain-containing protein [Pseudoclavibacter sp. JAI123]NYF11866.1 hypothetical protein [Pseudoclavibacter sp. JAI123]
MGILDRFERGLERVFNGAFAKTFRSGLQPVEISAALKREMDTRASVVTRDRVLVPNRFNVQMSQVDYTRISQIAGIQDELMRVVEQHAAKQGYQFSGGLSIKFLENDSLSEGRIEVDSRSVQGQVAWAPILDVDGERIHVSIGSTVIGRGSEADITIADTGASRKHAEVVWDGKRAGIRDLGSTNGTKVNGRSISQAGLEPDSTIQIGRHRIVFRVIPQADPSDDTGYLPRQGGRT